MSQRLSWLVRGVHNAINGLKEKLCKAPQRVDNINAKELVIGDRIRLKDGDIIPADAQLGAGSLEVDQSALTGESLPVTKFEGDDVFQGAIVKRGSLEAVLTATGKWTFFGKTSKLVANVHQTGNFQKVLFHVSLRTSSFPRGWCSLSSSWSWRRATTFCRLWVSAWCC